jgi:hypothetical protein
MPKTPATNPATDSMHTNHPAADADGMPFSRSTDAHDYQHVPRP